MLFAGETRRGRSAQWYVAPKHPQADRLARSLPASPLVAQALANRGLHDPEAAADFLNPQLDRLHDPATLPGCEEAAEKIIQAVRAQKRIVIYGDYDVDGLTAVSILWHTLVLAGAQPSHYIPSRMDEGYGLNAEAIRQLVSDPSGPQAELIITVDCGISAREEVRLARELGAEIIVTDHHELPADGLPETVVVHPRLTGSMYPNPDLCGAGVAFKLAWQIGRKLSGSQRVQPGFKDFLLTATSLAALGTIADIVPLRGENRILARYGLMALPETTHQGLAEFIRSCGFKQERLNAYHVGFVLAPRLNAAGRMGDAALACELLLVTSLERAQTICEQLSSHNRQRQEIERQTVKLARQMAVETGMVGDEARAIVLAGKGWHRGVLGLVASRLTGEYCRPTVIISLTADEEGNGNSHSPIAHGSCRSIEGFDMAAALTECGRHLVGFGGHKMAAGLKIHPQEVEGFRQSLLELARQRLRREDLVRRMDVEACVSLKDVTPATIKDLARMEPFGQGNRKPLFVTDLLELAGEPRVVGQRGMVLQFDLRENGAVRKAVCFDGAAWKDELCDHRRARVVFEPEINAFNGRSMAELHVKDVAFE